ncbi:MAG: terminase gpA endonuclease subunit [Akkermansiaceae bacterium]
MSTRVFKGREKLPFIDWCERNIKLRTTESRQYEGGYSRRLVLPMAKLWEMFLDGAEWKYLTIRKASQSTASTHALAAVVRQVAENPVNVVYAINSATEAANMGARLKAMLQDCDETAGVMDETPEDDKSRVTLRLPGMNIWFTGAGSAGQLANKPGVGLIISDESDKQKEYKIEAGTGDQLKQRGKTVHDLKYAEFCTPSTEDKQISTSFNRGSRHKFFCPCPREGCGESFTMEKDGLKYGHLQDLGGGYDLEEVKREAYYECPHCKGEVRDGDKPWMFELGEWLPTNFRKIKDELTGEERQVPNWAPGEISAQHNDFLAMWSGSSFGDIAVEVISAGRDRGKLHNLLNGRFGLPWKQGGAAAVTSDLVYSLRAAYERGGSIFEPGFVVFAADTQDDCWKWVMCAFNKKGDCLVSNWGVSINWGDMMEIAKEGVHFGDKSFRADLVIIDEGGHRTREVRRNAKSFQPWVFPCKGLGGVQVRTTLDIKEFGIDKEGLEKVNVVVFDDDAFKRALYRQYIFDSAKREKIGKKLGSDEPSMFFPNELDKEFVAEFCAERFVRGDNGKWSWEVKGNNDFGDAAKMCIIGHALGGHLKIGMKVRGAQ